jgi:hypothetical protein
MSNQLYEYLISVKSKGSILPLILFFYQVKFTETESKI